MAVRQRLKSAWRILNNPVDPVPRQLRRMAQVAWDKGFVGLMHPRHMPDLARAALQHGLKTRTIHEMHAVNSPNVLALVDDQRALTYSQANEEMNRVANALRVRFGVDGGTPVVLMMENRVEYVVAWFALARAGARAVHASYRLTLGELEYLVTHSGARVILCSPATRPVAQQLQREQPQLNLRLVCVGEDHLPPTPGLDRYSDVVASGALNFPERPTHAGSSENIVYTSGTTGKPKGAVRDFAAFGVVELARLLERLPFKVNERHLVVAPLYHSGGQVFVTLLAAMGATLYIRPHFEPEDCLKALSMHRIESMFIVPTMLRRLLQLPDEMFRQHPTPSMRGMVSGAAEFPHALRVEAIRRFGARAIHDFYGATELGWVTYINGEEMLRKPGSVGRLMSGQQVALLDKDGRPVPPGEVGLIYVRNAQTMGGYLHDQEATRQSVREGWMTVEDLGRMDADGYLFLAGRERDMVKSGGVNVYPVEIEEVLARHPAIQEVAVIGIPDPEWGERLVAVVVPRVEGQLDTADVESFARKELAGFKVPKRWELVKELPRNNTGKVMKKDLRVRYGPPPTA